MPKDFDTMEDSNRSSNPSIHDVSSPERRLWLRGAGSAAVWSAWGRLAGALAGSGTATTLGSLGAAAVVAGCATAPGSAPASAGGRQPTGLGFQGIPPSTADAVQVPPGYVATPLAAWGEPVGVPGRMPAFRFDASNSADDQALQMGMHHDGLAYFPLNGSSTHGLIAVNHEYTDDGLLHPDGFRPMTAEKVRKSQNAHGLSVYEVRLIDDDGREVDGGVEYKRVSAPAVVDDVHNVAPSWRYITCTVPAPRIASRMWVLSVIVTDTFDASHAAASSSHSR